MGCTLTLAAFCHLRPDRYSPPGKSETGIVPQVQREALRFGKCPVYSQVRACEGAVLPEGLRYPAEILEAVK